ncbi:MAG: hypothetical protein OXN81_20405, partial [Alphaproteobacteria bacterium]|nr:hypothetical protein [Alphaproteobacteria bacterium]
VRLTSKLTQQQLLLAPESLRVHENCEHLEAARVEQDLLIGKRRLDLPEAWFRGVNRGHCNKAVRRLLGLIGQEKPRFEAAVDNRDLFKVFVVEPQQSFERSREHSSIPRLTRGSSETARFGGMSIRRRITITP